MLECHVMQCNCNWHYVYYATYYYSVPPDQLILPEVVTHDWHVPARID